MPQLLKSDTAHAGLHLASMLLEREKEGETQNDHAERLCRMTMPPMQLWLAEQRSGC